MIFPFYEPTYCVDSRSRDPRNGRSRTKCVLWVSHSIPMECDSVQMVIVNEQAFHSKLC